jgi:AcrR family transcriptional regulator
VTATLGRPLDPAVTEAIQQAALRLLADQGFVRMSMEGIAREAGVGKPAIYRRFRHKAEVVATAITQALPPMPSPAEGPARERLWTVYRDGMPPEAEDYLALIGGLMAEHRHHPQLIEAFRSRFLLPRRAHVMELLAAAQASGELRGDLEPERMLDLLAGPILARAFAGADTGLAWREAAFADWWTLVKAR